MPPEGLEPPTRGLEIRCSIQLSYGGKLYNFKAYVVILIGTKGQLIKTAGVMLELQRRKIDYTYVQTDQHPSLNRILERKMGLKPPDINLTNNREDLSSPKDMLSFVFKVIRNAFKHRDVFRKGDILITQGDTVSTLLAVLIGKFFGMKVAHIEAGLRSFSIMHPFPEELVRRISSYLSDILFAPSEWAYNNLKAYWSRKLVVNTMQNTVYDVLFEFVPPREKDVDSDYVVSAIHRQETIYNRKLFEKAVQTIERASRMKKVKYILHRTSETQLMKFGLYERVASNPKVEIMGYLDYISFMELVKNSAFVITDGGGLQEETYYLNVPCLIMRFRTERTEGLGETAYLSKFEDSRINYFLENYRKFRRTKPFPRLYPSRKIVDTLLGISS